MIPEFIDTREQDGLDIAPLSRFDMYAHLDLIRVMEPETEILMRERAESLLRDDEYDSPHSLPWHVCLARHTEVVTRQGIREIGDIVGMAEILVPESGNKRSGRFLQCEVSSYGVQRTVRLRLRKHKQTKVIECTPAHRWYLDDGSIVLAEDLEPGQQLKSLRAKRNANIMPVPFAIAQGFVYGDGTSRLDGRPCHLDLFHNEKHDAMMPFFQMHTSVPLEREDCMAATRIKSLPKLWKELPDLRESRAFLLSWLSGYFCADGCVDERGYCTIDSASIESIKGARDILAICGIDHGQIQQSCSSGHYPNGGTYTDSVMYKLRISTYDVPKWFFQQLRHRERANIRQDAGRSPSRCWVVEDIEQGPVQEVFCATVPEHGCFGLADGLMTGNSFHGSEFPGDPTTSCSRYLAYRMMNFPAKEAMPPWVTTTGVLGKAGELDIADAWFRGGRMLAIPEDPEMEKLRTQQAYDLLRQGNLEAADELYSNVGVHQLGFVDEDHWMTVSTDLPTLPPGWHRPHIVELKCKADEVVEEMLNGRLVQLPDGRIEKHGRAPDDRHAIQLKATIGKAHEHDWGRVTVCSKCWFITSADVYERLGLPYGHHPRTKDGLTCPRCSPDQRADLQVIHLQPPTTGEIYYWSRSWPRKTKSYFFEHDQAFMDAGLAVLAETRQAYIEDRIPERPEHFQWSLGACKFCAFKQFCRLDSGLAPRKRKPDDSLKRSRLTESAGVEHARSLRPHYDPDAVRARVFEEWRKDV